MTNTIRLISWAATICVAISSHVVVAEDKCSIGLAKKFVDGIIAVDVKENNYRPGQLVFNRSQSPEYTAEYLKEQIELLEEKSDGTYTRLKNEIDANPNLHIYRMKYTWEADDNLNLGFYYIVRLSNYGRGCALKSIISD